MKNLSTLGRIIFALPLLVFGIFHFMKGGNMAGMVPDYLGASVFWVYLTGTGFILAGIALLINRFISVAGILLAIMLFIFAFTIHLPAYMDGDQGQMISILKNMTIAGGALALAGFYNDETSENVEKFS